MPAGTHATEGSDCRPDRIGAAAARSGRSRATSRPSGVPISTLAANPTSPRDRLSHSARGRAPVCHWPAIAVHTSAGDGKV